MEATRHLDYTGGGVMIPLISYPFQRLWSVLVKFHRRHLYDDPDVVQLNHEISRQADTMQARWNAVERRYLESRRS